MRLTPYSPSGGPSLLAPALAFALLFLSQAVVTAKTYFVDFTSGSNSNSGLSEGSAWKHCPGDASASGVPAATLLQAGDVIRFKGGVRYQGTIGLLWSGSASAGRITYDGGSWGAQRAIITTANAPGTTGFTDQKRQASHINIASIQFQDIGGYSETDPVWSTTTPVSNPPGGTGISLLEGTSDITISNCIFREIGQWQNQAPMSGTTSVTGSGVTLQDNQNVVVTDCDFSRMKTGVSAKAVGILSDVTIRNSAFHNYMNWLIDIAPRSAGATLRNIYVDGCRFYDYKEFDTPNWAGFGEKPHQNGIFLRTSGMKSQWENVIIRNSTFYSDQASAGGTASIFISQGPSVTIHNCAFLNDVHSNGAINLGFNKMLGMTQTVRILNCTFAGAARAIKVSIGNSNPDLVDIRNNVFYRRSNNRSAELAQMNPAELASLTMDHNIYFKDISPLSDAYLLFDGGYMTLSAWQKKHNVDLNSKAINPGLMSIDGLASQWDIQPAAANSSAALFGVQLQSFFASDMLGRPRQSPWGVGAITFAEPVVITRPAAPSGLRVLTTAN